MIAEKHRLITRSDFDGLVCAVLLRELRLIDDILFVHPKDMQDGIIDVTSNDITTNLPFVSGCHIAFDHHSSEDSRLADEDVGNYVNDPYAPSAARVVFDYYGGRLEFPEVDDELMRAVDKADSAQFSKDEILHPDGWVLLNYIMDSRTGLGRFRDFSVSNYQLMIALIEYCRDHSIEQILELSDVKERVNLYFEHQDKFKDQLKRCSTVHKNLVVLDLREEEIIYTGNRFMIYALFPDTNISIHAMQGRENKNTVYAIGKSITNRSSNTDIGELCLKYGGGGHEAAGTCQVDHDIAKNVLDELIQKINSDG